MLLPSEKKFLVYLFAVKHIIELRICLQNIRNCNVLFNIGDFGSSFLFHTYNADSDDYSNNSYVRWNSSSNNEFKNDEREASFFCGRVRLISRNGGNNSSFENDELSLGPLEYCVLACDVHCPATVTNETDFLAMMQSISCEFQIKPSVARADMKGARTETEFSVREWIHLVDESEVWNHYMELPGGVVLLRDKPLNFF